MVVRSSKFRHVHGVASKDRFENVNSTASSADSNIVAGNARFLALPWNGGGGPFLVHNLGGVGRFEPIPKMFQGHSASVQDLDFCPFDDCVIASASEDTTVRIWDFSSRVSSDAGIQLDTDVPGSSSTTLSGHAKKVTLVRWHPVARNLLLSVSYDSTVRLWDVANAKEAMCLADGHPDTIQHVAWNMRGSQFVTTCKDKKVRVCDPRTKQVVHTFTGHEGSKGARVTFLGARAEFATVGFSKQSERQLWFWDDRNTSKALHEVTMDQASGGIFPFFDIDTNLLYLGGKGDCNIRFFEVVDGAPHVHYVDQYSAKEPQRGMCMLPKLACDTSSAEVARFLRLGNGYIEPVAFVVPRKSDAFAEDLYPPTFSGKPSLSAEEWLGGKDADPLTVALGPGGAAAAAAAAAAPASSSSPKHGIDAPKPPPPAPHPPAPEPAPAPAQPTPAPPAPAAPPVPVPAPAATAAAAADKPTPPPPSASSPPNAGAAATGATPAAGGSTTKVQKACQFVVSSIDISGICLEGNLTLSLPSPDDRITALQERVRHLEAENASLRKELGR